MKKLIVAAVLLFALTAPARADSLADLMTWVQNQQAQVGTSLDLHGVKFACSWWDAVSIGQGGVDVGKAGALDYVDLGPGVGFAHGETPRYGQAIPIHLGNVWNSLRLPGSLASHVHLQALPNVTVAPVFLWPDHRPINQWRWQDDFQVAIGYRFGGASQ